MSGVTARSGSGFLGREAGSERLGAAPDLAQIDSLRKGASSGHAHGLTPRELQC
jgi:hypothetical protein